MCLSQWCSWRVQMVLGVAQCQMAFYLQQKAFEMPRFKQGASGKNSQSDRPANVRKGLYGTMSKMLAHQSAPLLVQQTLAHTTSNTAEAFLLSLLDEFKCQDTHCLHRGLRSYVECAARNTSVSAAGGNEVT